ncbi:hypothetical protein [Caudoviricetes sp.]|nr:hypothetical protein [Caudoviricetes sp.]
MSFDSYSDLQTSIASYLARSDLTTQIPDFIKFAETRLRRELRIRQMLSTATLTATAGTATLTIPTDFLEARDFVVNGNPVQPLNYVSPALYSRNSRGDVSGKPLDYTVLASTFKLAPNPDTAYTFTLTYYAAPAYLSASNTSNVFLTTCPDLLLYASLIEAEPFLMNDARVNLWGTMFDRSLASLTKSDQEGQYSGVPLVMRVSQG